jgi:NAD(P)-dependent dehydrogenase (short-subunit alcohol dehydrogenase family)
MSRYAVVTGSNRGLGKEIAQRLVQEGFEVAFVCRRLSDAQAAAKSLGSAGCVAIQLDFAAGEAAIGQAAAEIALWLGASKLMVLVNNAGNSYGSWGEESWRESRSVNYKGPVSFTQALLPNLMIGASVTMVGSGLGDLQLLSPKFQAFLTKAKKIADLDELANRPIDSLGCDNSWVGPYGLSKALVHRATEILAAEEVFETQGIRVNAVCPGWVCTDMGGEQAPISVEEGAGHILERALQSQDGITGSYVCYCYKNYDEEHNRAWEEKHGKCQSQKKRKKGSRH